MSAVAAAPDAPATSPLHRLIPLANIQPSKTNPRKSFDSKKLEELAGSVKSHGVLEPVLVRPLPGAAVALDKHEIVAGERRFRAATIAQLSEIPCIVRQLSDEETLEIQVIENVQRDDLHPMEEAQGYRDLTRLFKHSIEDIAAKVGKSGSYIAQRMSLTRLAPAVQKMFLDDKLNLSIALMIARIPVHDLHAKVAKEITAHGGMTVARAREVIVHQYMLDLANATFDTKDATLNAPAGACGACPKRTGNQAALFSDITKGDLCTDPICYRGKCEEHGRRLIAAAKTNGRRIIEGKEAKEAMPYEHSGLHGDIRALDDPFYDDPKHRTPRQILGKDYTPAVFVDPYNKGTVIEVAMKSALVKALKEQGVGKEKSTYRSAGPSAADKAKAANAKIESAARRRIFDALREKIPEHIHIDDWRLIADQMWEDLGFRNVRVMADLWAPVTNDEKRTDLDRHESVAKLIAKMQASELGRFLVDLLLMPHLDYSPYGKADNTGPLFDMAERYGVDVAKIRATTKAELAPAKKPSKKKADKKRPAK